MPTVAEMQLLNNSLDDLAKTLQGNRSMDQQKRQHDAALGLSRDQFNQKTDLDTEMLRLHGLDQADARGNRAAALKLQQTESERRGKSEEEAAAYRKELLELNKVADADKRNAGLFSLLERANQNDMVTDDGIAAMNEMWAKMAGKTGIGATFFRKPNSKANEAGDVEYETDPTTGKLRVKSLKTRLTPESVRGALSVQEEPADAGLQDAMAELTKQRAEHVKQIALGDNSTGFGNLIPGEMVGSRRDQVEELDRKIADLKAKMSRGTAAGQVTPPSEEPTAPKPSAPATFNTEAEARAAGNGPGSVVRLMINGKPTAVRLR